MENRNIGIDLLRIISMGMIVVLHLLSHGQIMGMYPPGSSSYVIISVLETSVYCAVDVFAMISGFVMVHGNFRPKKMLTLWGQVLFYSMGITILMGTVNRELITGKVALKSLLPVLLGHYWYFTAYFALFFFTPFLNELMKGKQAKNLLVTSLLLFAVLPTLIMQDPFKTDYGFSFVWLAVCYLIGAYLRINQTFFKKGSGFYMRIYLGTVILVWMSKVAIQYMALKVGFPVSFGYYLLQYSSPLVLISATTLVIAFSKTNIHNKLLIKAIHWMSSGTFAVYLLHEHTLIKNQLMPKAAELVIDMSLVAQVLVTLILATGILVIGVSIDYIRRKMFDLIKGIVK